MQYLGSLVPSPSHPSFYLAAGVGRTGNEASIWAGPNNEPRRVQCPVMLDGYPSIEIFIVHCRTHHRGTIWPVLIKPSLANGWFALEEMLHSGTMSDSDESNRPFHFMM